MEVFHYEFDISIRKLFHGHRNTFIMTLIFLINIDVC